MKPGTTHEEAIKRLVERVKECKFAMLTTVEADGMLRSRPMATLTPDDDGTLWFFTHASAPKVDEITHDQMVNVAYSKGGEDLFLSVSGTARLERYAQNMQRLWQARLTDWFPKGLNDPDLALLRVTPVQAEYWEHPSSPVAKLNLLALEHPNDEMSEKLDLQ